MGNPVIYLRQGEGVSTDEYEEFTKLVIEILQDPRSWVSRGDRFNVTIQLDTADTLWRVYGSKLSMYIPSENTIHVNLKNWNGGSQISIEGLMTLLDYRRYVIQHEMGHAKGLGHAVCETPGKPGSVMMQMSKGYDFIKPCLPASW